MCVCGFVESIFFGVVYREAKRKHPFSGEPRPHIPRPFRVRRSRGQIFVGPAGGLGDPGDIPAGMQLI